jgi:hypothetical protein
MTPMLANMSSGLRSTFTWERVLDDVIAVHDMDDGFQQLVTVSVTNDAERVVRFLAAQPDGLRDGDHLIYRDTQGQWDALLHQGGKFVNFNVLGKKTVEDAILAVRSASVLPVQEDDDPFG